MNKSLYKAFFLLITFTVLILASTIVSATNQTCNESISSTNEVNIEQLDVQKKTTTTNVKTNNKINADTNKNNNNKSSTSNNITTSQKQTNQNSSTSNNSKTIVKINLTKSDKTTKESGVMNITLDKSKKIYFAMDHTNKNDKAICNNVVNTLKQAGFNVVRYTIGPSAMYKNMLYLYNHKITNAIMFHLFNGVDPSNIKEVAKNGNDNRGRIVRSRGNDVVLAWFYDASDCVHEEGSCYSSVRGSETSGRMYNPRNYMDNNDIYYICTSSDHGKHKSTADYNGIKTANEFIKLFSQETITTVTHTSINKASVTLKGTVKGSASTSISGSISLQDSNDNIIQEDIKVDEGNFNTTFNLNNTGEQTIKVNFLASGKNRASNTTVNVNIPKNVTIKIKQVGNTIGYTRLDITVLDDKTNKTENDRKVYIKSSNGKVSVITTNSQGTASLKVNSTKKENFEISCFDDDDHLLNSVKKLVTVKKNNVVVTVSSVKSTIGEKVTLKATIKDQKGNPVSGGNVIFKLNNESLREDKSFDSNESELVLKVKNGVASVKIVADLKLRNLQNITAYYTGNYKYYSKVSKVVKAKINKRKAIMTVTASKKSVNTYETIEFVAKLNDTTPNSKNSNMLYKKAHVMFKVNGKTIKDSNGETVLVKLRKDNTARYIYTVAAGTAGLTSKFNVKNYNVTAILVCDEYYSSKNSTIYHVNPSSTKIKISKAMIKNNTLSVEAKVKDYKGYNTRGNLKVYLKLDDEKYLENDNVKYFTVKNGIVKIKLSLDNVSVSKIKLCLVKSVAYCSSSAKCTVKQ